MVIEISHLRPGCHLRPAEHSKLLNRQPLPLSANQPPAPRFTLGLALDREPQAELNRAEGTYFQHGLRTEDN